MSTRVYLEVGSRKVFACALDWPGWCRSAKNEDDALQVLADYAGRYAPVAATAGVRFPTSAAAGFDVVERLEGSASTDFGLDVITSLMLWPIWRPSFARLHPSGGFPARGGGKR